MKKLFNPAAATLSFGTEQRFEDYDPENIVYRNGDYTIIKHPFGHKHLYKNVVIMELVGMNVLLLLSIMRNKLYTGVSQLIYETAKERKEKAEQYAKEYNFKLENI